MQKPKHRIKKLSREGKIKQLAGRIALLMALQHNPRLAKKCLKFRKARLAIRDYIRQVYGPLAKSELLRRLGKLKESSGVIDLTPTRESSTTVFTVSRQKELEAKANLLALELAKKNNPGIYKKYLRYTKKWKKCKGQIKKLYYRSALAYARKAFNDPEYRKKLFHVLYKAGLMVPPKETQEEAEIKAESFGILDGYTEDRAFEEAFVALEKFLAISGNPILRRLKGLSVIDVEIKNEGDAKIEADWLLLMKPPEKVLALFSEKNLPLCKIDGYYVLPVKGGSERFFKEFYLQIEDLLKGENDWFFLAVQLRGTAALFITDKQDLSSVERQLQELFEVLNNVILPTLEKHKEKCEALDAKEIAQRFAEQVGLAPEDVEVAKETDSLVRFALNTPPRGSGFGRRRGAGFRGGKNWLIFASMPKEKAQELLASYKGCELKGCYAVVLFRATEAHVAAILKRWQRELQNEEFEIIAVADDGTVLAAEPLPVTIPTEEIKGKIEKCYAEFKNAVKAGTCNPDKKEA